MGPHVCIDASPWRDHATGVGRYVGGLVREFTRSGCSPTLVSNRPLPNKEGTHGSASADVVPLRPTLAWLQLVAPERARSRGCAVFHATTGRAPVRLRMPTVVTVHDVTPLTHPAWYPQRDRLFVRPWLMASMKNASAVIAVSRATAADLIAAVGTVRAPIHVIGHGVDPAFHEPTVRDTQERLRARYADGERFWLAVGGLTPRKNPVALVRAYAAALPQLGTAAPLLVLAGPGGPMGGEIRRVAERLGITNRLRLVGWVPQSHLPHLMAAADALVCPSLHEGFGLPVAEALAVGTPVVVARRGALPEVAGAAGFVVEPTEHSIAEALVRIVREPGLRAHLASEAATRGRLFDWRPVAEATAEVYRSLGPAPLTTGAA